MDSERSRSELQKQAELGDEGSSVEGRLNNGGEGRWGGGDRVIECVHLSLMLGSGHDGAVSGEEGHRSEQKAMNAEVAAVGEKIDDCVVACSPQAKV